MTETSIRTGAVAAILAAGTLAGDNVFDTHTLDFAPPTIPGVSVATPSSEDASVTTTRLLWRRTLTVALHCVVSAETDAALALALGTLVSEVRAALEVDPLDGTCWAQQFERVLSCSRSDGYSSEGDGRLASSTLRYQVVYSVRPAVATPPALTAVHIDLDVVEPSGEPDGDIDAELLIPVEA